MEKLTAMRNGVTVYVGPGCEYETGMISAELRSEHVRQVLNRLAAYEKTGLEPEEVYTLCSMDRRAKMADLLRLESYQSLGTFEELAALVNRTPAQACGMCINEYTDPELNSDNDLSYISIREHEKGYRALLRSGDGRPTAILFEKWTDGAGWTTIGHYQPKYCPNCGRELKENDHGPRKQSTKIEARPWKPQDLLNDLQSIIDEEPDRYLDTRRTTICTALAYLKEYFSETQPFPELTRGEVATEYLSICDEHDCAGDQSAGIQPCPFHEGADVDDSGNQLPARCKLKTILEGVQK